MLLRNSPAWLSGIKDKPVSQAKRWLRLLLSCWRRYYNRSQDIERNPIKWLHASSGGNELLSEGTYKIYEVSEMVGYRSQTHFGRNFQKQFGISPSAYLAQNK